MSKVDLISRQWCDIVFEGRNKEYGAYRLRAHAGVRNLKALITLLIVIAIVGVLIAVKTVVSNAMESKNLDKKYETIEVNEKTKEDYKKALSEIKNGKGTPTVVIKASDKATYKNVIDVLDEMQICTIGKYVIDNFTDADQAMIDNLGK